MKNTKGDLVWIRDTSVVALTDEAHAKNVAQGRATENVYAITFRSHGSWYAKTDFTHRDGEREIVGFGDEDIVAVLTYNRNRGAWRVLHTIAR